MYKMVLALVLYIISVKVSAQDLWQKAVSGYTDNYISGSLVQEEKVFREDGKLEESSRFTLYITRKGYIRVKEAVISDENITGKDLEILEYEANQNKEELFDPFDPELQSHISYIYVDSTDSVSKFEFKYENDETNITGECYINADGIPGKASYRLNLLPMKLSDYTLLELEVINSYRENDELKWKLYNVFEKSAIEISYLFMKIPLFVETNYQFK